jgi:hypothetical protein
VIGSIASFLAAAAMVAQSQASKAAAKASLACKVGMGLGLISFMVGVLV